MVYIHTRVPGGAPAKGLNQGVSTCLLDLFIYFWVLLLEEEIGGKRAALGRRVGDCVLTGYSFSPVQSTLQ